MTGHSIPDQISCWLAMALRADQHHDLWARKAAAELAPGLREMMDEIAIDAMGTAYAARLEAERLMIEIGVAGTVMESCWR